MRRGLLYAGVVYLAMCAFCYSCAAQTTNTRLGDTEEKKVDRMFLEVLSCEALESMASNLEWSLAHPYKCPKGAQLCWVGRALYTVRAKQDLADVNDAGHRRCGWDRD